MAEKKRKAAKTEEVDGKPHPATVALAESEDKILSLSAQLEKTKKLLADAKAKAAKPKPPVEIDSDELVAYLATFVGRLGDGAYEATVFSHHVLPKGGELTLHYNRKSGCD